MRCWRKNNVNEVVSRLPTLLVHRIFTSSTNLDPSSSSSSSSVRPVTCAGWQESVRRLLEQRDVTLRTSDVINTSVRFTTANHLSSASVVADASEALRHIAQIAATATSAADTVRKLQCAMEQTLSDEHGELELVISAVVHALLCALRFPDRELVGDLPLFYLGRALRTKCMNDALWGDAMLSLSLLQVAPKIFDLWVDKMFEWYERRRAEVPNNDDADFEILQSEDTAAHLDVSTSGGTGIPVMAVQAMLSWCAQERDVERCMKLYHRCKTFGIEYRCSGDNDSSVGNHQQTPDELRLGVLVKILATVRRTALDGGIKRMVVEEIRCTIPPDVIAQKASWGVINDLISALSFQSAMKVIKLASSRRGGDETVPFELWSALLRKAAKLKMVFEAESLFLFIRKRFKLKAEQKDELVDIMLRMHATSKPPNFASSVAMFLEHVVDHPEDEPALKPTSEHYRLLARAADSRNAAAMVFLEGCAEGIQHSDETFTNLFQRNPQCSIEALNSKLPENYVSSELDSQIRIPADADAHLRREEALMRRGKKLVDSTGEVR